MWHSVESFSKIDMSYGNTTIILQWQCLVINWLKQINTGGQLLQTAMLSFIDIMPTKMTR